MSERGDDRVRDHLNSRPRREMSFTVHTPAVEEYEVAAREVLWLLEGDRELGLEPGSFNTALIHALCAADMMNASLLCRVYPAMASTVIAYKTIPESVEKLRAIARGPQTP